MSFPIKPTDRAIEIANLIWKKKDTTVYTIARIIDAEMRLIQPLRLNDCDVTAGSMLRNELHAVIQRYGQESDVTVYQLLGCLDVVKQDILEMMVTRKHETH